ncbi:MAG: hypothetical protein ABI782_00365 [Anaerolineaceae bacterium]
MTGRWYRPLLAVVAVSMALMGGLSVLFSHTADVKAQRDLYTVEVLDSGFNPLICQVSRFDSVQFWNKSSKIVHIVQPDAGAATNPPISDLGTIAPGEYSGPVIKSEGGNIHYIDLETPSHTFTLSSPQQTENGPENCSPAPPTPTPTLTPTPGPTKTPTPLATPTPRLPLYCKAQALGAVRGNEGCAVAPGVARDDE